MNKYQIIFDESVNKQLNKVDKSTKMKIFKKINKLEKEILSRHLKQGLPFFVEEVGQYRICFEIDEKERTKKIFFIGNHKQYEKWYSEK